MQNSTVGLDFIFKMADNGAQEMEVYDTAEHKVGYVYMPVKKGR